MPAFTPLVKASKRTKPESILSPTQVKMMNLTNFDDSILLSTEEPAIFDATNLEEMVIDSIRTEGNSLLNNTEASGVASEQGGDVLTQCCVCEYEANSPNLIIDHEITQHGMVKCCKCDTNIFESLLRNHLKENHSENLPSRDETVLDKEKEEEEAIDTQIPEEDAPSFICGQCGLSFDSREQCTNHMATHLSRCYKCDFESWSKEEIAKHEITNHVSLTASMKLDSMLKSSNQVHMENATFYCKRCGISFEDLGLLAKHSIDKYGVIIGVNCAYCNETLAGDDQLKKHNEDVHNTVNQDLNKRRTDFKCSLCQKVIRTNIGIERHTELFCEQCKKLFTRKNQL